VDQDGFLGICGCAPFCKKHAGFCHHDPLRAFGRNHARRDGQSGNACAGNLCLWPALDPLVLEAALKAGGRVGVGMRWVVVWWRLGGL